MEPRERLSRRDALFLAICAAVFAASLLVILKWFNAAFPEASIEFKYDRAASRPLAERVLADLHLDVTQMKHAATFDSDDAARIYLERAVGLERANAMMRKDVHVWYWHHRWFRPSQEEEYAVEIAPTGEVVAFGHHVPENVALPAIEISAARTMAEDFLRHNGAPLEDLTLVSQSERTLPYRVQRIFTWESASLHPAGAPYRHEIAVDGNAITSYSQRVKVPDKWRDTYRDLQAQKQAAGIVDEILLIITAIAALRAFIIRLRNGDMRLGFLLAIGGITLILVTGTALNSFPIFVAGYDTTDSWPAFLAKIILLRGLLPGVGAAMALIVICGAGEVLYRERLPQHLAIPRLFTSRTLSSKRVFHSFVLGYAMVGFFLAYQVVFYLIAGRFGAWAPAEIPYDDMINTAVPWIAVLFAGFFPALSEEFLSRAFSIPFFERVLRSRVAAIIVAGFIWGFGHVAYPNEPFYIRGVEVGLAGVMIGVVFLRYGLLPLLIWHYTVDALYTSLMLFRSHNTYYVVSGALAAFVFAVPMLVSIARYLRNGGFEPDDDLSNATLPLNPEPEAVVEETIADLPPAIPLTRSRVIIAIAAAGLLALCIAYKPPALSAAFDYRTDRARTKEIARAHLTNVSHQPVPEHVIAIPLPGFKSWDAQSNREEGGSPSGGFDSVAATYLVRHGLNIDAILEVLRHRVEAGTWTVRFFTPQQKDEYFVEVDPREGKAIGYHRYQDEQNPGPRLDQQAAERIATHALEEYHLDPRSFDVKEALAFQQPRRRDWLFHFQEKTPIVAEAWRRVTVRVAGNEVTQFTTTVKVPDDAYREWQSQTLLNVALTILQLLGLIALTSMVVTGFVVAARDGMPWRRAAHYTAFLAVIPIATAFVPWEWVQFGYSPAVQWPTWCFTTFMTAALKTGIEIGGIYLSLTAVFTLSPWAARLFHREGRARFGRSGVVAAITAIAVADIAITLLQLVFRMFPHIVTVHGPTPPAEVAMPFPAALTALQAMVRTLYASAAVLLFARAVTSAPRRWIAPLITIGGIFCALLDPGTTTAEFPLALLRAAILAAASWLVARYILGENPIAWPLAIFSAAMLLGVSDMMSNHRPDLQANGVVVLIALGVLFVFLARRSAGAGQFLLPRHGGEGAEGG